MTLPLIALRVSGADMPIEPGSQDREWMRETPNGFARRCLPMLVANQQGWVLLNDQTFTAIWDGSEPKEGLTLTGATTAISHFGSGIITWTLPYLFRTPPGFDILLRGPANWPKDGACALEGVVESDWSPATATMNWKLTRPGLSVTFEAGEPFAMVVPVKRGQAEEFEARIETPEQQPELAAAYREWSADRSGFLRKLRTEHTASPRDTWQGDYFRGRVGDAAPEAEPHKTKLRLAAFREGDL